MNILSYVSAFLYLLVFASDVYAQRTGAPVKSVSTSEIYMLYNLNPGAGIAANIPNVPLALRPTNDSSVTFDMLTASANFINRIRVYDVTGKQHEILICFFKTSLYDWEMRAYVNSEEVSHPVKGLPRQISLLPGNSFRGNSAGPGAGILYLRFSPSGVLERSPEDPVEVAYNVPWKGSPAASLIVLSFKGISTFASHFSFIDMTINYSFRVPFAPPRR